MTSYPGDHTEERFRLATAYHRNLRHILDLAAEAERESIQEASGLIVEAVIKGGIVHVFGAGHSQLVAGDVTYRAGGLAWVNGILDPALSIQRGALASTAIEGVPEVADTIFYQVRPASTDLSVVISNSGVTPVSVRWAELSRRNGMKVISVVSLESMKVFSDEGRSSLKSYSDMLIDNHCPLGDVAVSADNEGLSIGPVSTIINSFLLQWMLVHAADRLKAAGKEVLVFRSGHISGATEHNREMMLKYKDRVTVF